jgi:hypothetical protein
MTSTEDRQRHEALQTQKTLCPPSDPRYSFRVFEDDMVPTLKRQVCPEVEGVFNKADGGVDGCG